MMMPTDSPESLLDHLSHQVGRTSHCVRGSRIEPHNWQASCSTPANAWLEKPVCPRWAPPRRSSRSASGHLLPSATDSSTYSRGRITSREREPAVPSRAPPRFVRMARILVCFPQKRRELGTWHPDLADGLADVERERARKQRLARHDKRTHQASGDDFLH